MLGINFPAITGSKQRADSSQVLPNRQANSQRNRQNSQTKQPVDNQRTNNWQRVQPEINNRYNTIKQYEFNRKSHWHSCVPRNSRSPTSLNSLEILSITIFRHSRQPNAKYSAVHRLTILNAHSFVHPSASVSALRASLAFGTQPHSVTRRIYL